MDDKIDYIKNRILKIKLKYPYNKKYNPSKP